MSPSETGPGKPPENPDLRRMLQESMDLTNELSGIDQELADRVGVLKIHGTEDVGTKQNRTALLRRRGEILLRINAIGEMTEALIEAGQDGDKNTRA